MFYWRLWFGQDQALPEATDHQDELVGPEVTIDADAIERFCDVGNQGEKFRMSRNPNIKAPMDFAIVTGRQVCLGFNVVLRILTHSGYVFVVYHASYLPRVYRW